MLSRICLLRICSSIFCQHLFSFGSFGNGINLKNLFLEPSQCGGERPSGDSVRLVSLNSLCICQAFSEISPPWVSSPFTTHAKSLSFLFNDGLVNRFCNSDDWFLFHFRSYGSVCIVQKNCYLLFAPPKKYKYLICCDELHECHTAMVCLTGYDKRPYWLHHVGFHPCMIFLWELEPCRPL